MYTVDENADNEFEEEYYEDSSWNNMKGLIFKIIIIILCIIVLIWLIKSLKNSKSVNNEEVHAANVLKVRLAAEDYFFLRDNKDKVNVVNLKTLQNEKLVGDIVDANNKVCSTSNTKVSLDDETDNYKMTINLDCSTEDKEEVYYYKHKTLACVNCDGKTHMDGKNVVPDEEEKKEEKKEDKKEDKKEEKIVPTDKDEYSDYSCVEWTSWSKTRIRDKSLKERTKTLVQGVKPGKTTSETVYSDWSEYTTSPAPSASNIEVETKTVREEVWSEVREGSNIDTDSEMFKILDSRVEYENTNSCNGYTVGDKCYSRNTEIGNLTYKEFNSGNYKINNGFCEGVKTLKNDEGKYVLTYINCNYNRCLYY